MGQPPCPHCTEFFLLLCRAKNSPLRPSWVQCVRIMRNIDFARGAICSQFFCLAGEKENKEPRAPSEALLFRNGRGKAPADFEGTWTSPLHLPSQGRFSPETFKCLRNLFAEGGGKLFCWDTHTRLFRFGELKRLLRRRATEIV